MASGAISQYFSLDFYGRTDSNCFIQNIIYTSFLMKNRMVRMVSALPIGGWEIWLLLFILASSRRVPSRHFFSNWRFSFFFLNFICFSCGNMRRKYNRDFFFRMSAFLFEWIRRFFHCLQNQFQGNVLDLRSHFLPATFFRLKWAKILL